MKASAISQRTFLHYNKIYDNHHAISDLKFARWKSEIYASSFVSFVQPDSFTLFTEYEILANQEEVLEILPLYSFLNYIATEKYVVSAKKALENGKDLEVRFLLIAAGLLERYDVLETKKGVMPNFKTTNKK